MILCCEVLEGEGIRSVGDSMGKEVRGKGGKERSLADLHYRAVPTARSAFACR